MYRETHKSVDYEDNCYLQVSKIKNNSLIFEELKIEYRCVNVKVYKPEKILRFYFKIFKEFR